MLPLVGMGVGVKPGSGGCAGRGCDKNTKACLSSTRKPTSPLPVPAHCSLHTLYSLTLLPRAPWTQGGHCKGRMGQEVRWESLRPALPTPFPRMHTPSTQNTMRVLGEVQGARKRGILPNKPHPATPSQTEPSHSPHKENEAQRGIAVGSGFHSVWRQSEAQDLGSHSQGLDSSHDARGHLLPTQQECPGLTTPQTPPSPTTQERQQVDRAQH